MNMVNKNKIDSGLKSEIIEHPNNKDSKIPLNRINKIPKNKDDKFQKWCLSRLEWTVSLSRAPVHSTLKWWQQTIDHRLIALMAVVSRFDSLPLEYAQDDKAQNYVTMRTVHKFCSASHTTLQKIVADGIDRKDLLPLYNAKGDKRHSINKNPDSDQKQIVNNSPKDQTKKRRPYNSKKQYNRPSPKQGVDDNRKKTYENNSRTNIENSKNSENRQNVLRDSGNVRRDNNSDSHKVKEIDGNRLDRPNDVQEK